MQEVITNTLSVARKQKLTEITYNFDLPMFYFSTESRQQGWFPWQQGQRRTEPEGLGTWTQLDSTHNSQVNIDLFNLPDVLIPKSQSFHAGSLKEKLPIWRQITGDPEILKLISGVSLNFSSPPFQEKLPHEIQFSGPFKNLVQTELEKFLKQGIIEPTTLQPGDYVSNLFARPKKTPGEIRLILNLKHLNVFVPTVHFKMESLEVALKLLQPNMYLASIDLTNSFYHLLVHPSDRKFLKFYSLGNMYRFTSLPMGFKESPRLFTKLMKVPLAFLRKHYNCIIVCYIDDLLIMGYTKQEVVKSVAFVANLLQSLGFHINMEKSELVPTQTIEFLGFILNTINMTVSLTGEKIQKIKSLASEILDQKVFFSQIFGTIFRQLCSLFPISRIWSIPY